MVHGSEPRRLSMGTLPYQCRSNWGHCHHEARHAESRTAIHERSWRMTDARARFGVLVEASLRRAD